MFLFIGTQEIIVIAILVLVLFGAKKIPEFMRNLGGGVKSFKEGMREDVSAPKDEKEQNKEKE